MVLIEKPHHIFNCDETGLSTVPGCTAILGKTGKRSFYQITSAERGVTTTVMCCCSLMLSVNSCLIKELKEKECKKNKKQNEQTKGNNIKTKRVSQMREPEHQPSTSGESTCKSRRNSRKPQQNVSLEERNKVENFCAGCNNGNFYDDKGDEKEDWIQCPLCLLCYHETLLELW